jgi:uncharacterized delta-60 repeat protein
MAAACLGTVAFASSSTGRESRARSVDLGEAMAAGRDGKLVVAGLSRQGSRRLWALARYSAAGHLDRRFGTGGKVLTDFGARSEGGARALAIRPDGRTVVAGYMYVPPRSYAGFAVARYTVSGELDRTFGRNGRVLTYFGSPPSGASLDAIALQADGKVVAVGRSTGRFALARYTLRGRLDPGFGRGGKVLTDFGARSDAGANAVAIQPDGKVVVAGDVFRGTEYLALARYNADGTLDRSFGQGGRVLTKVGAFKSHASALIVQPDGKLIFA